MRVLVTGREGQLVRSLIERSGRTSGLDLIAVGRPDLDMEDPDSIARTVADSNPEVIINAAAYTAVDQAEAEPERAWAINAEAPAALAAAARAGGARLVHISTDYVFDGTAHKPYSETSATNPLGVYGRSKLAGEDSVRREARDHLIVRTAWVYSPFGRNFLKTMMAAARQRDEVSVVDDQFGSPTSALDLADGLLWVTRQWREGGRAGLGETYHLAGSGEASWCHFAQAIMSECDSLGLPSARVRAIHTADWPTRAARPAYSVLDTKRFTTDFGYEPPHWRRSCASVVRAVAERTDAN